MDKKLTGYIYFFSILFALSTIIFFPKWIVDDAYITFRYSENLANHFQLTYNVNSHPVEGYTGIILPVIMAIAIKFGISPVIATHSIGVISFIISGIFLFLLLKKIKINDLLCSIIILIYSFMPIMYTHIFSGLETILFLSSIIVVIYFSIGILNPDSKKISFFVLFSILLFFQSLVRPEGIIFSILIILFCVIYYYTEKKYLFTKFIITLTSIFIIPFLIYYLWRWNYYGQFFPNTYYLKAGNFDYVYQSYDSFIKFFNEYFALPFIISLLLLLINIDKVWREIKNNAIEILSKEFLFILLPTLLFTIILLLQYLYTDLLMDFSHRFFIPTIPVFLILFAVISNIGFKNLQNLSKSSPLTYKSYIILIVGVFFIHFYSIIPDMRKEVETVSKLKILLDRVHIPTGKYIQKHFSENMTLLVHADAGAIPYYAKLKTIDFGGLNDIVLSHRNKLSKQQMIDYFFDVNADVLAITSFKRDKLERKEGSLNWNTLKYTLQDERFTNYSLIKIFSCNMARYYEYVFVRNDLFHKMFKEKN